MIVLALALTAAPPAVCRPPEPRPIADRATETSRSEGGIEVRRTGPDPEIVEALSVWLGRFRPSASAVLAGWRTLGRELARTPETALGEPCLVLRRELARLDRRGFLPVPEVAADRSLRETLEHLEGAARACSELRPFALEGRLAQAADAWRRFVQRLGHFGLEP